MFGIGYYTVRLNDSIVKQITAGKKGGREILTRRKPRTQHINGEIGININLIAPPFLPYTPSLDLSRAPVFVFALFSNRQEV